MKKAFCAVLVLIVSLCLGAGALAVGMPNPWVDATAAEVMQALGVEFGVPEGAEAVSYAMLPDEELAEMRFSWYGMDYTARIKPADCFEDISGMYYEWDLTDACSLQGCDGQVMRANEDGMSVDLCLWYDAEAGLMYSVSAGGEDLDGFDIMAAAQAVYVPATAE